MNKTEDGLPVVSEDAFRRFLNHYDLTSVDNDPEVRERISRENPQIARIIGIGKAQAPNHSARVYYEMGAQVVYELLRRQSTLDLKCDKK